MDVNVLPSMNKVSLLHFTLIYHFTLLYFILLHFTLAAGLDRMLYIQRRELKHL